jgi:hypothetical protein
VSANAQSLGAEIPKNWRGHGAEYKGGPQLTECVRERRWTANDAACDAEGFAETHDADIGLGAFWGGQAVSAEHSKRVHLVEDHQAFLETFGGTLEHDSFAC